MQVRVTQPPVLTHTISDRLELGKAATSQHLLGLQHVQHFCVLDVLYCTERGLVQLLVQQEDHLVDVSLIETLGLHSSLLAELHHLPGAVEVEHLLAFVERLPQAVSLESVHLVLVESALHLLDQTHVDGPAPEVELLRELGQLVLLLPHGEAPLDLEHPAQLSVEHAVVLVLPPLGGVDPYDLRVEC